MTQHARPHLQTHNRSEGHSAVAGAAYRLGLRLYDERAKKWCDHRQRKVGEEIVYAITVAPEDAPDWARDPAELWNRVEAAEKRKDAQVARDYRIPIPFGLTDEQAGNMAEQMARFIAAELHTSVSMGLHRDADVDVLGNLKPADKQGFHAHIYFPTRRLEQLDEEGGSRSWGLGAKLVLLSNKRTSSAVVEAFNAHWAMLSNRMTAANDLIADYDHRSYVRQDLAIEPQSTLGRAATAMERRGILTKKGDELRGAGVLVSVDALQVAQSIVLDVRRQEMDDEMPKKSVIATVEAAPVIHPATPLIQTAAPIVINRVVRPPTAQGQSLSVRFHTFFSLSTSADSNAREPSMRVAHLVSAIGHALNALLLLAARLARRGRRRECRVAEKQDALSQLERSRALRSAARETVRQWEAEHPVRVASARMLRGAVGAKPVVWQVLLDRAQGCNRRVQELKDTVRSQQAGLVVFDVRDNELKAEQARTHQALELSLEALAEECATSITTLLSIATADESALLKAAMPGSVLSSKMTAELPEHALKMARPRASPRM